MMSTFQSTAVDTSILECQGLSKEFGGVRAVDDVSLSVGPGEILGLIGPNGAGKSTLINLMSGLFRPDAGKVIFGGRDVTSRGVEARTELGLIRTFQQVRAFGTFTVAQALDVASRSPRSSSTKRDIADTAEQFQIGAIMSRRLNELPYGLQKIVNLALVGLSDPRIILLDEPFAGVLKEDVHRLGEVIASFAERGTAVCLVEHDMETVMRLCPRIVVLAAGKRIFSGTPKEVREHPEVREVYLGTRDPEAAHEEPKLSVREAAGAVAGPATKPMLEIKNLTVGYGQSAVLHSIDVEVQPGEVVAVVGPNGAGKTTLLKAIGGILKKRSGSILFEDREIANLAAHVVVRRGVTYVPEGREVFAQLSVQENLWLGAFSHQSGRDGRMATMLEVFPQLKRRLHLRAGKLSGGEQQMLAIARGLMSEPKLLLIDEPTLGLAPILVEQLGTWLAEVQKRLGTTLVLVEQSAKLARDLADRMYVLVDGEVKGQRGPGGFNDDELFALYVGEGKIKGD
jgi:ABC-type branched-subunit amino acid transport system ATPase component